MTAETDIAALTDGGQNPISSIRTALTSVLRRSLGMVLSDDAENTYWSGSDSSSMTAYTGVGARTLTEQNNRLSVKVTSATSSDHVQALLASKTISIGDFYAVEVASAFNIGWGGYVGVVMTDGTAGSSNACSATFQFWANEGTVRTYTRHGTLNAMSTVDTARSVRPGHTSMIGLEYDAANSFLLWVSSDGISWTNIDHIAVSDTITPTHVGLLWYSTSVPAVFTFGPLIKTTLT